MALDKQNSVVVKSAALENIKEEIYLSKGGVIETNNQHVQDHNVMLQSPLIISPSSSNAPPKKKASGKNTAAR